MAKAKKVRQILVADRKCATINHSNKIGHKTEFLQKNENLIIKIQKNVEDNIVFVASMCYIESTINLS